MCLCCRHCINYLFCCKCFRSNRGDDCCGCQTDDDPEIYYPTQPVVLENSETGSRKEAKPVPVHSSSQSSRNSKIKTDVQAANFDWDFDKTVATAPVYSSLNSNWKLKAKTELGDAEDEWDLDETVATPPVHSSLNSNWKVKAKTELEEAENEWNFNKTVSTAPPIVGKPLSEIDNSYIPYMHEPPPDYD